MKYRASPSTRNVDPKTELIATREFAVGNAKIWNREQVRFSNDPETRMITYHNNAR
jgi:hypothetical protein